MTPSGNMGKQMLYFVEALPGLALTFRLSAASVHDHSVHAVPDPVLHRQFLLGRQLRTAAAVRRARMDDGAHGFAQTSAG